MYVSIYEIQTKIRRITSLYFWRTWMLVCWVEKTLQTANYNLIQSLQCFSSVSLQVLGSYRNYCLAACFSSRPLP
jgi:hypothetical protein